MELKDVKAIVTGGSSGIGHETASEILKGGGNVLITGRNEDKLKEAAAKLGCNYVTADSANENDVIALIPKAAELMGGFNTLINNAAYGYFNMLTDMDLAEFNKMMATNVTGAMLAGREAAKYFKQKNYGNIINISSTAGLAGFAGGTAYVASKFALKGMTECWRAELRKSNIRVMLVNPSEVQTNFVANSGREARPINPTKLEAQEIAHLITSMLKMRDVGFITEATVFATNPQ
jgi:3-oxoacyl-[acyl-carrier protein] reductase